MMLRSRFSPMTVIKDGIVHEHGDEELEGCGEAIRNISQIAYQTSIGNHCRRNSHQLVEEDQQNDLKIIYSFHPKSGS